MDGSPALRTTWAATAERADAVMGARGPRRRLRRGSASRMEAYAGSRSRMRTRRALTQPLGASSFISKTIVGDSCVRAFQSSRARPTDGSDVSHAGVCDVTLRLKRFARQCRKSSAHMVRTPRLPARRIHFSIYFHSLRRSTTWHGRATGTTPKVTPRCWETCNTHSTRRMGDFRHPSAEPASPNHAALHSVNPSHVSLVTDSSTA